MTRKLTEEQIEQALGGDSTLAKLVMDLKGWGDLTDDEKDFEYWCTLTCRAPANSPLRLEAATQMASKATTVDKHQIVANLLPRDSDLFLQEIKCIFSLTEDHNVLTWCAALTDDDSELHKEIVGKMFQKAIAITYSQWQVNLTYSITPEQKNRALTEMFSKAVTQKDWMDNCAAFSKDPEKHKICFQKVRELNQTAMDCLRTSVNGSLSEDEKIQIFEDALGKEITFEICSLFKRDIPQGSEFDKKLIAEMEKIGKFDDWKKEYEGMATYGLWKKFTFEKCLKTGSFSEILELSNHLFSGEDEKKLYKALFKKASTAQKASVYRYAHNFPDLQQEFLIQITNLF